MSKKFEIEIPEPGTVLPIGADHVLFCTRAAKVGVTARRCPHLDEDLVSTGIILGEELVCKAHGWRIGLDGSVSKVSIKGRRDVKGSVPMADIQEGDGGLVVCVPDEGETSEDF